MRAPQGTGMFRRIQSSDPDMDAIIYNAVRALAWAGQDFFEAAEGALLRESLRRHGYQRAAAKALGTTHATVNRKLKKWGMQNKQVKTVDAVTFPL